MKKLKGGFLKICVIDACFPVNNQTFGMAALWMQWYIPQCGGIVTDLYSADVVAITCVFPDVEKTVRQIKKITRAPIVCGGSGALSPYSIGKFCDAVCVGNGQRFLKTLCEKGIDEAKKLPESWIDGESRHVDVASGFCWDCPPVKFEQNGYRVFCGRGCKKKCKFCQTGWAIEYEENPNPKKLISQINNLREQGKTFAYLSNDPMQHSFFKLLPNVEHGSYSLDFIKKNGLPSCRQIRLGVEGVSERLRELCGKPISHNDLVKATVWLNENKKSVRWFMIAGLPTEDKKDWHELMRAIMDWKKISSKGSLQLSFTAWCPEPATPFGKCKVKDDYWDNWISFKDWFFDGDGWSNRVRLFNPQTPKARMEKIKLSTGMTEDQLRTGGSWGPNDRVNYPYKKQRNEIANRII